MLAPCCPNRCILVGFLLSLAACGGGGGGGGSSSGGGGGDDGSRVATTSAVELPVEVIGPDGYTREVTVDVEQPAGIDNLYLELHRPVYRDASVASGEQRGPKASVRLNDGPWQGLSNDTVFCADHEAEYGCLNGTYHTVRLTLPVSGVVEGENTLAFRFNGHDEITSGYRVLEFDFVRDTGGRVFGDNAFATVDPATWQPPIDSAGAVTEGRDLWHNARLDAYPEGPAQRASCSGCHAGDGRDLEYFAYSNHSIIERAKFHGLSQREGELIASYIRANDAERRGRPWNPPYQPGPGLDDQPVKAWAAGAGVDAVLEDDIEMLSYLFDDGISKDAISPDGMLNMREQPVAIQLPDWNAWLPNNHPTDIWGDFFLESDEFTAENGSGDDVLAWYDRLKDGLAEHGVDAMIDDYPGPLRRVVERFGGSPRWFLRHGAQDQKILSLSDELAAMGLRKWMVVKQWSLQQRYGYADRAPQIYGSAGEPRSWLGQRRTVFDFAPHIIADDNPSFAYQSDLAGKFESTAWYQLQLVLNSGNGAGGAVDWNYHPEHIQGLAAHGGPEHPVRLAQSFAKNLEQYSKGEGMDNLRVRQIHPGRYGPGSSGDGGLLGALERDTRNAVYEALLGALMDKFESHSLAEWNSFRDAHLASGKERLKPADHVPSLLDCCMGRELHGQRWVDAWYTVIPQFRASGVDEIVLERMIAWAESMWPNGDWDAVREHGKYAWPE